MPFAGAELLQVIGAQARPAGSDSERRARELCARELSDAGFSVADRPFDYSAFPGLWGTPVVGVMLLTAALATALGRADGAGVQIGLVLALAAGVVGWWLARHGGSLRLARRRGVNLEAWRGVPKVWLVAHLDSKTQPVSLLVRAAAVVITCVSWVIVLLACAGVLAGMIDAGVVGTLAWVAVAGAVPLVLSWVRHGDGGTGALDNASGVAAVMQAAVLVNREHPLGVVLSSGEELGLVGARAWLAGRRGLDPGVAINCDGIDDDGAVTCTIARDGGVVRSSVVWVVSEMSLRPAVRVRNSLPGVLFDAVAFADAGWPAVTVSRGTLGSLARVHTRADTLDRLHGAGVEQTAHFMAALAGAIIAGHNAGVTGTEEQTKDGSTGD